MSKRKTTEAPEPIPAPAVDAVAPAPLPEPTPAEPVATEAPKPVAVARSRPRLRHWKERFDPKARFIFSIDLRFAGVAHVAGSPVPDGIHVNKLRWLWNSGRIQRADFVVPPWHDPSAPAAAKEPAAATA